MSGPIMQFQAMKYTTFLGYNDFKASNGWVNNFKKRNGISYKTIVGEGGLIQAFKTRYRKQLVLKKVVSIEYGHEYESISLLESIEFIAQAWGEITSTTISNCFRKAGFKKLSSIISDSIDDPAWSSDQTGFTAYKEAWDKLNAVSGTYDFNHWAYLRIDDNIAFSGLYTDEEICVNSVPETFPEPDAQESPESEVERTTIQEGMKSYEVLTKFLQETIKDNSDILKYLRMHVESQVQPAANKVQSSLTSFFPSL